MDKVKLVNYSQQELHVTVNDEPKQCKQNRGHDTNAESLRKFRVLWEKMQQA